MPNLYSPIEQSVFVEETNKQRDADADLYVEGLREEGGEN